MTEHFDHDVCPKCGVDSKPAEGVVDQTLRYCPRCFHEWYEDLNEPVRRLPESENSRETVEIL